MHFAFAARTLLRCFNRAKFSSFSFCVDITAQPPRPDVVPSIFERNALVIAETQERAAEQRAAGLGKNIFVRDDYSQL